MLIPDAALWHWFDSIVSDTEFTHINYIYILYTTITYSKIQGSTSSLPAITHMITHLKRLNKVVVPQTATLLRMLHLNQIQLISPMGDLSIWKISSCLWMGFCTIPKWELWQWIPHCANCSAASRNERSRNEQLCVVLHACWDFQWPKRMGNFVASISLAGYLKKT